MRRFQRGERQNNEEVDKCVTSIIGYLVLPKVGKIKVKQHREIPTDYQLKSM